MTHFRASLGDQYEGQGGWIFSTREQAERWCEQFGNTFIIVEVEDE